jgi:ATP-dependent Clp protease adaptor protein ClpS
MSPHCFSHPIDTSPANGPVDVPLAPVKPSKPKKLPPTQPEPRSVDPEPLWNVILLNDDEHSFQYVINMLADIFAHPPSKGFDMATEVHETGRVICATVHKELAELRQEQIHEYGPDPSIPESKKSMRADIEPAV